MKWQFLLFFLSSMTLLASNEALASNNKPVVIVSGAGGQTGQSLFRKLLASSDFEPIGLVRSAESKQALLDTNVPESNVVICDVTDADAVRQVVAAQPGSVAAFCICTSAKPQPSGDTDPETGRPTFVFPNGDPEVVDWMGKKNQIDACPPGTHVVVCSTMGGTNPEHPLNKLGLKVNEDGTTEGGMIVQWKRKAEVYLMEQSPRLLYTIVHPGGLINEPGGERELVVGVDDDMSGTESRSIPREDVAQIMMEAIRNPGQYAGRSFDARAKPVGEGSPTTQFATLLDSLKGKNCDYTLGATM